MSVDIRFISNFLNRDSVEGPRQFVGYIPCWIRGTCHKKSQNFKGLPNQKPEDYEAMGGSGVTIATGCDMGQTDEITLREYGVRPELISILSPYIGLKTNAAIRKLSQMPLRITPADAEHLDNCVHAGYLNRYVRPAYDKASNVKFDDLPKAAQAAVFSLCFQKGCGGVRRDWPMTWHCLTNQNWSGAAHELKTGFRQYAKRRWVEGKLLEELL